MSKSKILWFFIFTVLMVILVRENTVGILLSDEYNYSINAVELAVGDFTLTNHPFKNRFGLLLPMAVSAKLGGFNWFNFVLPTTLFAAFFLLYIFHFFWKKDRNLGIIITALFLFNPTFIQYSSDISQDLIATVCVTIALLLTWDARRNKDTSFFRCLTISFLLFYSFITKESIIFSFPFFLILLFQDLKSKERLVFWRNIIFTSTLLLVAYFSIYYFYTGDPFFRFNGIEEVMTKGKQLPWEMSGQPLSVKLKRISIQPIGFLLGSNGYGIFFIFSALWIFTRRPFETQKLSGFLFLYLVSSLFFHWFCTTSLSEYNPLILADRMQLPLVPPMIILTGLLFFKSPTFYKIKLLQASLLLLLLICAGGLFVFWGKFPWFISSIFAILFVLFISFQSKNALTFRPRFIFLLFVPLIFQQVYQKITYQDKTTFFIEKEFLSSLDSTKNHTILTDTIFQQMPLGHFDFEQPQHITFRSWNNVSKEILLNKRNTYYLIHQKRIKSSEKYQNQKPPFFKTGLYDTLHISEQLLILEVRQDE